MTQRVDIAALEPYHLDPGNVARVVPVCCHPTASGARCTRKAREGVFVLCGTHFDQAMATTQRLFDAAVLAGRSPEEVLEDTDGSVPEMRKYRYLLDKKRELGEYLVLRPHVVFANYGRWCDEVFQELSRMERLGGAGRLVTAAAMASAAREGYAHLRPSTPSSEQKFAIEAPPVIEFPDEEPPSTAPSTGDLLGM